jgi:hypothetical protein
MPISGAKSVETANTEAARKLVTALFFFFFFKRGVVIQGPACASSQESSRARIAVVVEVELLLVTKEGVFVLMDGAKAPVVPSCAASSRGTVVLNFIVFALLVAC